MAVNLSPIWGAGAQLLDNSGNVLSGGKIYTYAAGTTTLTVTYTSNNGITANSNPIVLNSAGRVPYEIWLLDGQNYKFVLKDSNDVLIGTWDNLSGINSNFIAYTNQQEIQTATAGQTVFNLVDMQYLVGTNSLSVFVDGVNQYGPGAQYAYEETDSTTVTFASGLHVGAEVKFTSSQIQNAGVADASQISYTPDANSLFTTTSTNVENVLNLISNETNGSDYVGFNQDLTDSIDRTVSEKLKEYVSVKDFGAVGDGVTDDTDAIQAAWDSIKSSNGTLFFPAGTYRCDDVLDFTVDYVSSNHFHAIVGNCATIDFSNTALTTGDMITFGSGLGLFEEKTRFVMEGLSLIGPSLGSITPTSVPPHNLVGIFFNYALNLTLRNITVFNFYIGYKVDVCFPIVASAVVSDNCYVGLQLVGDVTCSSWVGCTFKEGRFGVVIQPKANNKAIYGQTFIRPLLEGNDVGMVLDPLDGSGYGIWDIDIIDPYLESVGYDGFRIGRAIDYSDATVVGADRSRNAINIRVSGGVWDGQWGTSGHQPVVFHAADTADAPAGCVIDIPVQLSTASIGYSRKSQLNNRIDLYQGSGTVITDETQYQRKATSLSIVDGTPAPNTELGWAQIYVDSVSGDLKIVFGDGTVKTIVTD